MNRNSSILKRSYVRNKTENRKKTDKFVEMSLRGGISVGYTAPSKVNWTSLPPPAACHPILHGYMIILPFILFHFVFFPQSLSLPLSLSFLFSNSIDFIHFLFIIVFQYHFSREIRGIILRFPSLLEVPFNFGYNLSPRWNI